MITFKEIQLNIKGEQKIIQLGFPTTPEEFNKMYELRYLVYKEKDYIDENYFPEHKDIDDYDREKMCDYLIAKIDDELIGTIRLIKGSILPIKNDCFSFNDPDILKQIPDENKMEAGRLVIKKYDIRGQHLPRNLVLLGLMLLVVEYGLKNNIQMCYAFIKKSLKTKLDKLSAPIHYIEPYKIIYNKEPLKKYFNQVDNPVYPVYFLDSEMKKFIQKIFYKTSIFKKINENKYELKNNLYTKFLQKLKII